MKFILFHTFLTLLLGIGIVTAEELPTITPQLSGSEAKLSEALSEAHSVVVAKIVRIGSMPSRKSGAYSAYHGVRLQVSRVLKGAVDGEISVSIFVRVGDIKESLPRSDGTYIFLINGEPGALTVRKILEANAESIAAVLQSLGE